MPKILRNNSCRIGCQLVFFKDADASTELENDALAKAASAEHENDASTGLENDATATLENDATLANNATCTTYGERSSVEDPEKTALAEEEPEDLETVLKAGIKISRIKV